MNAYRRVVLIVLDGAGVGALPDACDYGDESAATLPHVAEAVGGLCLPNLQRLGLGNICGIQGVSPQLSPAACWGKMAPRSAGKDSVTGHWEIAGLVRSSPFACFPNGFPPEIIQKFTALAGLRPLGNVAESGTDILRRLGEQHLASKRPIVYTSSDSVFQIAAHEDILAPAQLYQLCEQALEMLRPYGLCRVIARPFIGDCAENFTRTSRRHDFPVAPAAETILDLLQGAAVPTCGIGKIGDLFAGRGLDRSLPSRNNAEGMTALFQTLDQQREGLIFVNLVDFDMLYGHRLDPEGFAAALHEFDRQLPQLFQQLSSQDLLLITADHGCDPTTQGTDHCREYVPLLAWSAQAESGCALGMRSSFSDIAATLAEVFMLERNSGESFLSGIQGCDATDMLISSCVS
jgi:phosphopentomutase